MCVEPLRPLNSKRQRMRSKAAVVVAVAVTPNAQAYNAIPFWIIGQSIRGLKRQAYKATSFQSTLYFDLKNPRAVVMVVVTPVREAYETVTSGHRLGHPPLKAPGVRRELRAAQTAEQQEAASAELRNGRTVQPAKQLDARGNVVHYSKGSRWFKRLESGDTTFGDQPRSRRPSTVDDEALQNALNAKPNATTRELATTLEVTHMAMGNHLNDLGYRKIYSTWVSHRLSDSDKASRARKTKSAKLS
ncbi:unnamed protein product [Darwinula stevensoni]|uniref:Uncharacterized protein n=1 Tax=Darwinula stevensoni TaxID=69355 RepID=A0A7R9A9V9_9CRUS|nr:unnamed protein product [Darwinula stevensoni]CAG0897558.1 unnamed protein product [Darwinula stevensoni]